MIPLLSTWTVVGPEETQEGRWLSSFDGTPHLKFCIQCPVHPVHRPYLPSARAPLAS